MLKKHKYLQKKDNTNNTSKQEHNKIYKTSSQNLKMKNNNDIQSRNKKSKIRDINKGKKLNNNFMAKIAFSIVFLGCLE